MKAIFLICLILFITSCSEGIQRVKMTDELIQKDTMVMVIKDLSIIEAHIKNKFPPINQSFKSLQKSGQLILEKYNVDTTRFNASMDYYGSIQKMMQYIYSQVLDSVNRELTELTAK